MIPRAITGRIMSMARPSRPAVEREIVRAAVAAVPGASKRSLCRALGRAVAETAIKAIDDPADRVAALLASAVGQPIETLALNADIDVVSLIQRERCQRLEARGWRHLPEAMWERENADIIECVSQTLANRYRKLNLRGWS